MTTEKSGIRSIFDLFRTHRPIPAVPSTTLFPKLGISVQETVYEAAVKKRLKRQKRNLSNQSRERKQVS